MLSVKTYYVFFVVVFLYATKEASHPALDLVQELIQWGSVSVGKVSVDTLQIPGGELGCALLTSQVLQHHCVILLSCFSIVPILMQKLPSF